jgi:hypothetical protein
MQTSPNKPIAVLDFSEQLFEAPKVPREFFDPDASPRDDMETSTSSAGSASGSGSGSPDVGTSESQSSSTSIDTVPSSMMAVDDNATRMRRVSDFDYEDRVSPKYSSSVPVSVMHRPMHMGPRFVRLPPLPMPLPKEDEEENSELSE